MLLLKNSFDNRILYRFTIKNEMKTKLLIQAIGYLAECLSILSIGYEEVGFLILPNSENRT
jgi:hypothetical protein